MITEYDDPSAAAPERWERLPERLGYERTRESITALLAGRPELAAVAVPACPGWTVRDLLAHLLDVCKGVVNGTPRLPLEHPDPDNEADLAELLDRWPGWAAQLPDQFEELLGYKMTMDILVHELDLRHALGVPVLADHPAYPASLDLVTLGMGLTVIEQGLPALRFETPGASWLIGRGEPAVTVRGHRHDLFRSLTGRRTHRQIARLDWSEPPERWLPAFTWPPFDPPAEPFERMADGS